MNTEQLNEQQLGFPSPVGFMHSDSKSDLLDKIRPEDVIEEIKQRLMGKEWNSRNEKWVLNPSLKDIALTEVGSSAITNLMFPASTRSVSISSLKDEEIKKRLLSLVRTGMKMCLDNWETYGIKHTSQLFFVKEIIYTNTLVALKQPENEGIRRLLNSIISENRNVSTYGEEKGRGMIAGLFRKK